MLFNVMREQNKAFLKIAGFWIAADSRISDNGRHSRRLPIQSGSFP